MNDHNVPQFSEYGTIPHFLVQKNKTIICTGSEYLDYLTTIRHYWPKFMPLAKIWQLIYYTSHCNHVIIKHQSMSAMFQHLIKKWIGKQCSVLKWWHCSRNGSHARLHYITVSVTFTSRATAVLVHDCLVIAKSQFTAKLTSHCCLKFNGN